MKSILTYLLLASIALNAQDALDITESNTTSLGFEYPIIHVDRGSRSLRAQKVQGVENAIHIKAATNQMDETNLTVFTRDGSFHHFFRTYNERFLQNTFTTSPKVQFIAQVFQMV